MTRFIQGKAYPAHSRDELIEQMPLLNKQFLKYADFAMATIENIISTEQIAAVQKMYDYQTASAVLINNNGKFSLKALPIEAQFSCVSGISYQDYDGDGQHDLLLSGNFFPFRVQQGNCDASIGLLLKGNKKGEFKPVSQQKSGLYIPGDARDMITLKGKTGAIVIISKNSGAVQVIRQFKTKVEI